MEDCVDECTCKALYVLSYSLTRAHNVTKTEVAVSVRKYERYTNIRGFVKRSHTTKCKIKVCAKIQQKWTTEMDTEAGEQTRYENARFTCTGNKCALRDPFMREINRNTNTKVTYQWLFD